MRLEAEVIGISIGTRAEAVVGSTVTNRLGTAGASVGASGGSGFSATASASAVGVGPGAPVTAISTEAFAIVDVPLDAFRFPDLLNIAAQASAVVRYTNTSPIEVQDTSIRVENGQQVVVSASSILPPGIYGNDSFTGLIVPNCGQFPTGTCLSVSINVQHTRLFIPLNTNVIRWINPQGGSYFDANNWSPPQVPVKNEQRADVAVFDLPGDYTVNLAPPAGAAGLSAAGAESLTAGATADRWVVATNSFSVDGNARVSTLSLFNPSVAVSDSGRLNLVKGTIESVHASIGHEASASVAQVLLANDGTEWLNTGRLTIGREGPGRLHIFNGVVTNAEARIGGDEGAFGEVAVNGPDAFWLSGNTAIGYNLGKADLIIEHSGRVTSSLAVVGFGPGQQNTVTVDGAVVGVAETPSTWTVQDKLIIGAGPGSAYVPISFGIGSAGTVEVKNGGLVNAPLVALGSGANAQGRLVLRGVSASADHLPARMSTATLLVGHGSEGDVVIEDGAELIAGEIILESEQMEGNVVRVSGGFSPPGGAFRPSRLETATARVGDATSISVSDGGYFRAESVTLIDDSVFFPGLDLNSGEENRSVAQIGQLQVGSPLQLADGPPGFSGLCTVEGGSLMQVGDVVIGGRSSAQRPADGTVVVRGVGVNGAQSRLTVTNDLAVGLDGAGAQADESIGQLLVRGGGLVTSDSGFIGNQGVGHLVVEDFGTTEASVEIPSTWSTRLLFVGRGSGNGFLEITNRGQVHFEEEGYISFAQAEGKQGVVKVSGAGSKLDGAGSLTVAASLGSGSGKAFLIVEDSADIASGDAVVAQGEGTRGFVTVRGTNATDRTTWTISGNLKLGTECLDCGGIFNLEGGEPIVNVMGALFIGELSSVQGSGHLIATGETNPPAAAPISPAGFNPAPPSIINEGTLAPGSPLGTLHLTGNFEQIATGRLRIEACGNGQCGQLNVNGNVTLGGTLEMVFRDNYLPQVGDTIPFLNVSGATQGAFHQTAVVGQPYNGRVDGVFSNGAFLVTSVLRTNYQILHTFGPANLDGINGWGPLTVGSDGFLYGCARNGGEFGAGVVFRLRPEGYGYEVLHIFNGTNDGAQPLGGVIEASDGLLYGTTSVGGEEDMGTVWRMGRDGRGFEVIRLFRSTNDCRNPQSELIEGSDGRLYGTTFGGGGFGRGGIFRINKDGTGYRILTGFGGGEPNAPRSPVGGLIEGPDGAFYGATESGGSADNGAVFRMTTNGTYTVLRSLGTVAGGAALPNCTLLLDSSNVLFGATYSGGTSNFGTVFKLNLDGSGFGVIKNFGVAAGEGREPRAGLVEAPDGSLLGTTRVGGGGQGTIFRLRKDGSGFQSLRFFGAAGDGARPRSALAQAPGGVFYGATFGGGTNDQGVLFRLFAPGLIPVPSLVAQPRSFIGPPGSVTTLQVRAAGSEPFFYQWQHNGLDLPGAILPTLALPAVDAASVGVYAVRVSSLSGTNLSAPAYVTLFNINPDRSLILLGEPGAPHRIDFSDLLTAPPQNWLPLTNVVLPAGPMFIIDPHSGGLNQRFYRAVKP
jgi:T5SS/PEP-CTERM-associated repeat protein/uncharacterized repeat protein (TIGR03803 family)